MSLIEDAIPGVAEAKEAFAIAKVVWPVVAAVGGAGAVGAAWLYVQHLQHAKQAAETKAAVSQATATGAQGQSGAQTDAAKIVDLGRAKADVTVHTQQENQRAILSAPGASDAVDPGLMSALVGGLCRYDAYRSDPACAQVRPADPGQLPPASSPSSDTSGNDWGFSSGHRPANGPA
jgi:hypothetical protein